MIVLVMRGDSDIAFHKNKNGNPNVLPYIYSFKYTDMTNTY